MKKTEILLKNVEFGDTRLNIQIKDEIIHNISEKVCKAEEVIDCDKYWVLPGAIDPHVHMRDMDQAYKEDWKSGSSAAIRGGITMIFDMPNTKPATTNLKNLNIKRKAAQQSKVNYRFYLGATNRNIKSITSILKEENPDIIGIKVFLSASSSNVILSDVKAIRKVFELGGKFDKMVTIHTELEKFIAPKYKYPLKIENHNTIRSKKAAITGLEICLQLAKTIGNKINIAHVTCKEELDLIREYKTVGKEIYCEVTPHHLLLNEEICPVMGNIAKVNPPLRKKSNNDALWEGINNFTIDMIASDHAPHAFYEKRNAYSTAPAGIPGLDTTVRLMTTSVNQGKLTRERMMDLISTRAVHLFNLGDYGKIIEKNKANLTIIDPDKKGMIKGRRNKSKARFTPFENFKYQGAPVYTIINGKLNPTNI